MNETVYNRNAKLDNNKPISYDELKNNWCYYRGDHFQNPLTGEIFWIGSIPTGRSAFEIHALSEIKRIFTSHNKIKECVNRHIDSLIALRPTFTTAQKGLNNILTDWVEDIYTQAMTMNTDTLLDPLTKGVLDGAVSEIGYWRLFERSEFKDPIKKLGIHSPDPNKIKMFYSKSGLLKAITYQMYDDKIERQELDYETGLTTFYYYKSEDEFSKYQAEIDATVKINTDVLLEPPKQLDLGGNFTIIQYRRQSLITETLRNLQDGINLNLTMMISATSNAGFLERIITNAMPPGDFVDDGMGGKIFKPSGMGYVAGAGASPLVNGIPIGSPSNPTGYTNPSVTFRPPVDTQTFTGANSHLIDLVYEEFNQSHMRASGDGSISGVSRIQVKADFLNMITRDKGVLEAVLNQLGLVAMHLLLIYSNRGVDVLKKPKAVSTLLNISNDSLLPEEITAHIALYQAGLRSKRTSIENTGCKDVEEELRRINEDSLNEIEQLSLTTTVESTEGSLPAGFQKAKKDVSKPPED